MLERFQRSMAIGSKRAGGAHDPWFWSSCIQYERIDVGSEGFEVLASTEMNLRWQPPSVDLSIRTHIF